MRNVNSYLSSARIWAWVKVCLLSSPSSFLPYTLLTSTLAFNLPNKHQGKIAAQCSHATLACYKSLLRSDPKSAILRRWEKQGQAKVALKVDSEEELQLLHAKAVSLGITAEVIADAGRTQVQSGSFTVLGVGPALKSVVDLVTGALKLL